MINIGFADELPIEEQSDDQVAEKHGEQMLHEKRATVYFPEKRVQELLKDYDCVVVHDFGDEYHMSEEERENKNQYYQTFKLLKRAKRTYRKIDEFVEVTRLALKCLDDVAETNGVYDPEKFKELYFRGKIKVTGLIFPKYKGRNRKELSWDYITEFILGDEDPSVLVKTKDDDVLSIEEMERMKNILFTKEELEEIMRPESEEDEDRANRYFDVEEDKQEGNVVVFLDNKDTKRIIKNQPELIKTMREIKRRDASLEHLQKSYVHEMDFDDMEAIEQYDQKHNYKTSSMIPEFTGDIMNSVDYDRYMAALEEYEDNNIKENYDGKMRTGAEIRELELKDQLEDSGWNIRALYNNREKEKKLAEAVKRDRKREKRLKQQLLKVQERKKRRTGEDSESSGKKKKGKKKKQKESD